MLAYSTIKVYLSPIRSLHVATEMHLIFSSQLTPRVQQVTRGIQNMLWADKPVPVCPPITIDIMDTIKATLNYDPHKYNHITWVALML